MGKYVLFADNITVLSSFVLFVAVFSSLCKSFSANASLVTLHNDDEMQYVYSTMLSETTPQIETNAWTGMYKEGFGEVFYLSLSYIPSYVHVHPGCREKNG